MKISNSKKQLAKIISENGGWREGAQFSAQDKDGEVFHYSAKPTIGAGREVWGHKGCIGEGEFTAEKLPNWHQTILSRDEYFHLYPAKDADGWIEWKGGECPCPGASGVARRRDGQEIYFSEGEVRCWSHDKNCMPSLQIVAYRIHRTAETESVKPERIVIEPEPTIEQLAADYRAKLAIAQQAQEEADSHRCGAEAALEKLVAAGKAVGLVVSVASPEPELVITDWRDLQVGDEIATTSGRKLTVTGLRQHDESWPISADDNSGSDGWCVSAHDWRFIRRPSKEVNNA